MIRQGQQQHIRQALCKLWVWHHRRYQADGRQPGHACRRMQLVFGLPERGDNSAGCRLIPRSTAGEPMIRPSACLVLAVPYTYWRNEGSSRCAASPVQRVDFAHTTISARQQGVRRISDHPVLPLLAQRRIAAQHAADDSSSSEWSLGVSTRSSSSRRPSVCGRLIDCDERASFRKIRRRSSVLGQGRFCRCRDAGRTERLTAAGSCQGLVLSHDPHAA